MQEFLLRADAAGGRSVALDQLAQMAQGQFRMQVLAALVDLLHDVDEGRGGEAEGCVGGRGAAAAAAVSGTKTRPCEGHGLEQGGAEISGGVAHRQDHLEARGLDADMAGQGDDGGVRVLHGHDAALCAGHRLARFTMRT